MVVEVKAETARNTPNNDLYFYNAAEEHENVIYQHQTVYTTNKSIIKSTSIHISLAHKLYLHRLLLFLCVLVIIIIIIIYYYYYNQILLPRSILSSIIQANTIEASTDVLEGGGQRHIEHLGHTRTHPVVDGTHYSLLHRYLAPNNPKR
jgi:hypothetical protein